MGGGGGGVGYVQLFRGGRVAKWFRAPGFNAVTRVQIPVWPLAGVVLGECRVQLLGHPCK